MPEKFEKYEVWAVGSSPTDVLAICLTEEDADRIIEALAAQEKLDAVSNALAGTTPKTKEPKVRKAKVEAGAKSFKPKKCVKCGADFVPHGTRQTACDKCRAAGDAPPASS